MRDCQLEANGTPGRRDSGAVILRAGLSEEYGYAMMVAEAFQGSRHNRHGACSADTNGRPSGFLMLIADVSRNTAAAERETRRIDTIEMLKPGALVVKSTTGIF